MLPQFHCNIFPTEMHSCVISLFFLLQTSSLVATESPRTNSPQRAGSNGSSSIHSAKIVPSSPVFTTSPLSSPKIKRHSPYSPKQAPRSPRHSSPPSMNLSLRRLSSPSMSPTATSFGQSNVFQPSPNLLTPYDNTQMGRRSPRQDRSPSPLSFNHPMSSTLPRNFGLHEPGRWRYYQPASCCHVYQGKTKYE